MKHVYCACSGGKLEGGGGEGMQGCAGLDHHNLQTRADEDAKAGDQFAWLYLMVGLFCKPDCLT